MPVVHLLGRRIAHAARRDPFQHLRAAPVRLQVRMVEGHQCHRVAHSHRKLLQGHAFQATSPNARFADGAKAISGQPLTRIEVHGKNLFYFFGEGPAAVVMHVHFGMSGHFRVSPLPGPEAKPTTRLRLASDRLGVVAMLSAMTVQHGGLDFYASQSGKLGPDPLREDADPEAVWGKMRASRKPVGLILMDQSMVAGIGNIYRAEILYKARVHPEQPGNTVDRATFESLWRHSVLCLQRGFKSGSILTVDPEDARALGPPWTRRYIYNQTSCGRCGGEVQTWDMAARTVYCCPACQPLVQGISAARAEALDLARPHQKFRSACAPDPPTPQQPTAAELRARLAARGLPTGGRKAQLAARLAEAPPAAEADQAAAAADVQAAADATGAPKLEAEAAAAAAAAAPGRKRAKKAASGFDAVLAAEDAAGQQVSGLPTRGGEPPASHWGALSLAQLKPELRGRGLPVSGKKAELVARLEAAAAEPVKPQQQQQQQPPLQAPAPGTADLGRIATAEEAEREKAAAGEGRDVEHVALQMDASPQQLRALQAARPEREGEESMAVATPLAGSKRTAPAPAESG